MKRLLIVALTFLLAGAQSVPTAHGRDTRLAVPEQALLPLPVSQPEVSYIDLDRSHWAASVISLAGAAGLFQGYPDGSFRPSATITRAEFLAVLMRAYPRTGSAGITYLETPAEHWAYQLIHQARGAGLLTAYPQRFDPDEPIRRGEIAVMLQAFLSLPSPSAAVPFPDVAPGGMGSDIATLTAYGILQGFPDGGFYPGLTATRAEAAAMVARLFRPTPPRTGLPVLLYHTLKRGADTADGAVIDVAEFETQIAWLDAEGYQTLTVREVRDWLDGVGSLPERPVLITFDDGYRSNYEEAFPILRRYNMKATIFVISHYAGRDDLEHPHFSWAEMQEMRASNLIEIQAHTHDGHWTRDGTPALLLWSEAEILADLKLMRITFELGGQPVPESFAYPHGAHDERLIEILSDQGYTTGFTVESGLVQSGDDPFRLKRLIVEPGLSLCDFARLVGERACRS